MHRVLAVDDEPKNLKLIEGYLDEDDFLVETTKDGLEAWNLLQKDSNFDLILLDRMMPNMNGMEFLAKIKSHETLKIIPVIMQTAAAEKNQVLEGIKAGVFHYLTKPYDEETLLSIIDACLRDADNQKSLREEMVNKQTVMGLIKSCHIEYRTINEANAVATYIATLFPNPTQVIMGISELLINAVEHGNLGIDYETKSQLNSEKQLHDEIERLLNLPDNQHKYVEVDYHKQDDMVTLRVKDQGKGFDWQEYMELSVERATDNHGRGIAMANAISFDNIEYKGCGNEVICTSKIKEEKNE